MSDRVSDEKKPSDSVTVNPKTDRRKDARDRREAWRGGRRATDWPQATRSEPLDWRKDNVVPFSRKTG